MSTELIERLEKTLADLGEHRETHVVWRDWLRVDAAREKVNPHAGSADFHEGVIADYDRHLGNIREAIDAIRQVAPSAPFLHACAYPDCAAQRQEQEGGSRV